MIGLAGDKRRVVERRAERWRKEERRGEARRGENITFKIKERQKTARRSRERHYILCGIQGNIINRAEEVVYRSLY